MRLVAESVRMTVGERTLFENLTLELESGSTTALMGPSGVGKSTLLGGIAGVRPFARGRVLVEDIDEPPRVSWMFQSSPLLYRRSAVDNVAVAFELRGMPRVAALEKAADVLATLGLRDRTAIKAHKLSGGERQRVAVARAIAASADLLLADEPTASLDSVSRELVVEALKTAAREGAAVIIATHDNWVASRCDQCIELQAASG